MVPGKVYRPEDYVEILWRRKWLLIVPFVVIGLVTVLYTQTLPDQYRSLARVLVVPQQVPTNYVQSTVTDPLKMRLDALSDQIQSRTRLERLIQDFNLYERERQTMLMEDVIALMRRNVIVQIPRTRGNQQPGSFTVGFTAENPRLAMQVADRLASMFVTENLQDRAVQADQTTQFLETQLETARRRLMEQEQKLEAYRLKYAGQLPSQVQTNLQVMQTLQAQAQSTSDAMIRDRDRLAVLDKQISDLLAAQGVTTDGQPSPVRPKPSATQEQLAQAREALRALEMRLTPQHPDVIRARRVIRDLEVRAEAEALNTPLAPEQAPAISIPAGDRKRLADLQAERDLLQRGIAANGEKEARLQNTLPQYRARVEAAPARESELTELTRDYETIQEGYKSLLARNEQARMAADLERRQIGQQFRIIDPARVPEQPLNTRTRLNLMGILAGLGFGLGLVAFFEYRDTTLRTDDDVVVSLALPVLAVIPAMATRAEVKRNRQRRLFAAVSAVAVTLAGVAVVLWRLDVLSNWLR
jgi:polysaccharide chain length determinant protein (PEP-CTERM system associated)